MRIFEFNENVVEIVLNEIKQAEKFINIAIFQIHREDIFKILNEKLEKGLKVEIFTLPYESIHSDNKEQIENRFKNLENKGAKLYFCRWNVGNPSRTTTAVGLWFSFHGKFIITDKSAISLSANFTEQKELDAVLIYRKEKNKIDEFKSQFEKLKKLFIEPTSDYNGTIHRDILETNIEEIERVFVLPNNISKIYDNLWIRDYPIQIISKVELIENKLYIAPFDGKGRSLLKMIIEEAEEFIFISTETFTDPDFPDFLKSISFKGTKIKILSGLKTMDFGDRVKNMFRELIASNILIRTTEKDLHAKLIITDKHIIISSINLNKISLGFRRKKGYWRENTETFNVCSDEQLINVAKKKFEEIFESSKKVEEKLGEQLGEDLAYTIRSVFGIRSVSKDVKEILGFLIFKREIETKRFFIEISQIIPKILREFNKTKLDIDYLYMGIILHILNLKQLKIDQIKKEVKDLDLDFNVEKCLEILIKRGLIWKKDNRYCSSKQERIK